MARLVKCPRCEQQLKRSEGVRHSNRYYHKSCYQDLEKKKKERQSLFKYIESKWEIDCPTKGMMSQIKDYEDSYGYSLREMEICLRYFYDTLGNEVLKDKGIGIIPHVYDEAINYFQQIISIAKKAEENPYQEDNYEVVKVDLSRKKKERVKLIDIDSLC